MKETKVKKGKTNLGVAYFLALKNLFFKKSMLILIVLIISLGYLSMTLAGGIILGLEQTITNNNIQFMTGNILLEPNDDDLFIANTKEIEKKILAQKEVLAVSPQLNQEATFIDDQDNILSARVSIIDPDKEREIVPVVESMMAGEYFSDSSNELGIIFERNYLEDYLEEGGAPQSGTTLDAGVGETIDLLTTSGNIIKVKIIGVYDSLAFGNGKIYMSEKTAKEVFNLTDNDFDLSSNIVVKTHQRGGEEKVVSKLKKLNINAQIFSWSEKLDGIEDFIGSLLIISNFTTVFGVIVSFATVFIMIYINVIQKRSQIGIMKAIGINGKTILSSYIFQSFFYGLIGGLIGFAFTAGIVWFFSLNPIAMPMGDVVPFIPNQTYVSTFIVLFTCSIIAGYIASRGVIKEKILDAIFKG